MAFKCEHLLIQSATKDLVNISFSFGRTFALIGESGSGKSLTLKALLGMLPSELTTTLRYDAEYTLVRGKSVAFVPQNPFTALSPLTKIKKQFLVDEAVAKHYLSLVELDDSYLERFPSELSGGQLQRIVIAMALSLEPKLLLLDEPTTALDEANKEIVLRLIEDLQERYQFDILFVTHDISTIENVCEEIAILQRGEIVEMGRTEEVLASPSHAYTKQLLSSGFKQRSFRT